jgi:hypothetical protein
MWFGAGLCASCHFDKLIGSLFAIFRASPQDKLREEESVLYVARDFSLLFKMTTYRVVR